MRRVRNGVLGLAAAGGAVLALMLSPTAVWDAGAYQTIGGGGGTSFYVDPNATGTGSGTSWANAWTSFSAVDWSIIGPADTLYVSGGASSQTYVAPSFTVGASGTSGNPITIRPGIDAGHNGVVIFDYASLGDSAAATGISLGARNNVTITGDVGGSSHWVIENLYNTTSGLSSVGIAGSSGNTAITVNRMTFVNDNNPVRFTSTAGITISNNSFRRVRGDAAIAMAGSTGGFGSSRVFGNYIERECKPSSPVPTSVCDGPDGVQVGSGVSIYDNDFKEITTTATTSSQHPDAIQAQGDNLKIYGNTFTNVGDSDIDFDTFSDARPHDVYVYNNVFRITNPIDRYPEYFRLYRSSGVALQSITNFKILNNTFVDNTFQYRAVRFDTFGGNPTGSGNQIENNIFYNVGDGTSSGPALYIDPSTGFTSSSWTIDYNTYYLASGRPYIDFEGTNYTASKWVSRHEPHGKVGAPTFVSYTPGSPSNDFHLAATDTVARDAGAPFSSIFTTDKDGISRPQGSAWDIGAYQYHSGAGAGLYVSPHGSDVSSCSRPAPCRSLQRAFRVASRGDIVRLLSGTYPAQTISGSKAGRGHVIFEPAAGAHVRFAGSLTVVGTKGLTFRRLRLARLGKAHRSLYVGPCTSNVTFDDVSGEHFLILEASRWITFKGGSWGGYSEPGEQATAIGTTGATGPEASCNGKPAAPAGKILFDHVTFHDVFWGVPASGWGTSRPDCFEINGYVDGLTIRHSRFLRCASTFMQINGDQGDLRDLVFEGNLFEDLGGDTRYGIQITSAGKHGLCGDVVFERNTYLPDTPHAATWPNGPIRTDCEPLSGTHPVVVSRNIFARAPQRNDCSRYRAAPYDTVWANNLFGSGACGSAAHHVPFGYRLTPEGLRPSAAASAVRRLFALAVKRSSLAVAVRTLRREHVRGPAAGWSLAAAAYLLRDRVYAGGAYGAPGTQPPLISRSLWRAAQRVVVR